MIDYFKLHKACLAVLSEYKPEQTVDFLNLLKNESYIQTALSDGIDSRTLVLATYETLDNLIEQGLIKATKTSFQGGDAPIYIFKGVTTEGNQYLKDVDSATLIEKIKRTIQEDGIPVSKEMLSKFISKIIF